MKYAYINVNLALAYYIQKKNSKKKKKENWVSYVKMKSGFLMPKKKIE